MPPPPSRRVGRLLGHGFDHLVQQGDEVLGRLADAPDVGDVAADLLPLEVDAGQPPRGDAPVGAEPLDLGLLRHLRDQVVGPPVHVHLGPEAVDLGDQPVDPRLVAEDVAELLEQRQGSAGDAPDRVRLVAAGPQGGQALGGPAAPLDVDRRPGRQRAGAVAVDRLGQRHHDGAPLGGAALGGVDDRGRRAEEVALELLQVGEEPFLGVHRAAAVIGDRAEDRPLADDLLPLLHLDRAEAAQLGPPDVLVAGAGGVVQAVAEAQVLADEQDRVAAQVLGQVVRQVGHGAAGGERGLVQAELPQQALGVLVADQRQGAGVQREDGRRGLGFGHQLRGQRGRQPLEEAGADVVVVQRGDEVRFDAQLQQRLERGLHGDDHAPADHRPDQVLVLPQRRAGRDDQGGVPLVGVLQPAGAGGGGVGGQVAGDVLQGPPAVQHQRVQVGPGEAGELGQPGLHLAVKRGVAADAGGVEHVGRAERQQRGVGGQPREQLALVGRGEEQHAAAVDQAGQVAVLQRRPQQHDVGLEDAEDGLVAGAVEQLLQVVAQPQAEHVEHLGLADVDRGGQPGRLLDRAVAAVEVRAAGVGRRHAQGQRAVAGRLDGVDGVVRHGLDGRRQQRVGRPEGRQVRQVRVAGFGGVRGGRDHMGAATAGLARPSLQSLIGRPSAPT